MSANEVAEMFMCWKRATAVWVCIRSGLTFDGKDYVIKMRGYKTDVLPSVLHFVPETLDKLTGFAREDYIQVWEAEVADGHDIDDEPVTTVVMENKEFSVAAHDFPVDMMTFESGATHTTVEYSLAVATQTR